MKDLTKIINNLDLSKKEDHQLQNKVPPIVKTIVDSLFDQLAYVFPAWKYTWDTEEKIKGAKKEWVKSFFENGINTKEQISLGLKKARCSNTDFLPSCGKFVSWCLDFDTTEAYSRMINRKPVLDDVEYYTRQDCGYQCKRVLDDVKARALFNKTFKLKLELKRKGKLPIRDQKLLSEKSVVTEVDREISDLVNTSGECKKHQARMARIKAAKLKYKV